MKSPFDGREIRFLTGSQHLYGPEVLDQVAAQSRAVAEALDASGDLPVRVVWQPVLTTRDAIRRAVLEANADDACVGVVAWMHTFSPARMWIGGLEVLAKPLAHLHTQAEAALPWATIDMDFMNLNQAAHGDREFGFVETRLGVARTTVVGHTSNPAVTGRLGTWARAATAWADARTGRLVRFGDNMRDVAVTDGDKIEAERVLGVSVNSYGVTELAQAVAEVADAEVAELVGVYDGAYTMAPELRPDGARRKDLAYAARLEIALRAFLAAHDATAFTDTFEDLGELRQLPGIGVQRLMADGYGFGAEGDWKTAILVRAAKVMGHGLPGGASLMEDYTYHLVPGEEKILGAHMLEVCPSLTTSVPSCEIHPLSIGGREDPVRLVFDADAGPGLVMGLADLGDRFRLTANLLQVVGPDEPMPNLPVGRAVWRPEPDFYTSAACWLEAGAPHHTAMTTAVGIEEVRDFAAMAGLELVEIGPGTTREDFARTLRWNKAYHHLARGL